MNIGRVAGARNLWEVSDFSEPGPAGVLERPLIASEHHLN
jgi:hypothetical protein